LKKPVVLIKLGRSAVSGAIAQAHTGSLIGDDGVFDAMCRKTGIIRCSSLEEVIATANLIANTGPIDPPRIALCSISGGACALLADLSHEYGLDVVPYSDETQAALAEVLPSFASTLNPLDTTGVLVQQPELWQEVIPILARDANTGLVIVGQPLPNVDTELATLTSTIEAITAGFHAADHPAIIVDFCMQTRSAEQLELLTRLNVEVPMPGLLITVRALANLQDWSKALAGPVTHRALPAPADARPVGERETLAFLGSHGVPVIPAKLVTNAGEAMAAAGDLAGPVVCKIASPDIAHKTEAGGVMLGVDPDEAGAAFEAIVASASAYDPSACIDGVLVAPMRSGGTELIVGVSNDPEWGLAITVGTGGVLTEILGDSQTRLLPIDEQEAQDMVLSLKGAKLLQGFRGAPTADLDGLARAIVAIGDAAAALGPELAALEVNPIRVSGHEIEALDALAIWNDA